MDARTQMRLRDFAAERGSLGFTFDDLAAAAVAGDADADSVGRWLAEGRESGELVLLAPDALSDGTLLGPRRFCLAAFAPRGGHECCHGRDAGSESPEHHELPAAWS